MQLGLSTYSYTWAIGVPGHCPPTPMTLRQLIDEAQSLGLQVVQIADNAPLHLHGEAELEALYRYALEKGIRLEVGTRGLSLDNVRSYLAIAGKLRSDILRIVVDGPHFEPSLTEVMALLTAIVPLLRNAGIRLAIENHDRFLSEDFAQMASAVDPEWIGICLDSVNSLGAGEGIAEVVKTLAPLTINLHLKEFTIKRVGHKMGFVVEGLPAGQGMLAIPAFVGSVGKNGRCRSAILELWTPPAASVEETIAKERAWVNDSVAYLKATGLFV